MLIQRREMTVKAKRTFKDKVFFWKGIPVALTAQLADFYETSSDVLMKNFHRNEDKFRSNKHYFKLQRQQILKFLEAAGLPDWGKNVTVYIFGRDVGLHVMPKY